MATPQEKKEQLKKEGKLLTGKQKEEAKRLAAVREQMLKQAGVKLDDDEGAPKKQKVSGRVASARDVYL